MLNLHGESLVGFPVTPPSIELSLMPSPGRKFSAEAIDMIPRKMRDDFTEERIY
jgi:hypothetical protein